MNLRKVASGNTRIICLSVSAIFLLFASDCGPSSTTVTADKTFPLTIMLSGPLTKNANDPLPDDVIEISLPFLERSCSNTAFFPQVGFVRADLNPGKVIALEEKMEPASLEKEAQNPVQKFFRRKPSPDKIRTLAQQKIKNVKSGDNLVQPGNRQPQPANDLKAIAQRSKASKIFVLPAPGENADALVESLKKDLSAEFPLIPVADEKTLLQLMGKDLCERSSQAAGTSEPSGFIVLYQPKQPTPVTSEPVSPTEEKPPVRESGIKPSVPCQKPSLEARQHIQQGMTYVSLARQNQRTAHENYNNAIREFGHAIELCSCYATAYANRGLVYMQQGKFNLALNDLNEAIKCNPQDWAAYYNRAAFYSLQKQLDLALVDLDEALGRIGEADRAKVIEALRNDRDLNNLRQHPEFRGVLEKHNIFLR